MNEGLMMIIRERRMQIGPLSEGIQIEGPQHTRKLETYRTPSSSSTLQSP